MSCQYQYPKINNTKCTKNTQTLCRSHADAHTVLGNFLKPDSKINNDTNERPKKKRKLNSSINIEVRGEWEGIVSDGVFRVRTLQLRNDERRGIINRGKQLSYFKRLDLLEVADDMGCGYTYNISKKDLIKVIKRKLYELDMVIECA